MRNILFLCLILTSSCIPLPALPDRGIKETAPINPSQNAWGETMRIYIPDVGQGDATLIQSPDEKWLLIDAGPPAAGRQVLLPLLRELNINTLDALLITHYDLDHLGGVPSLLAGEDGVIDSPDDIKVGAAYDRGGSPWDNSPGLNGYLATLDQANIPRHTLLAGEDLRLGDLLKLYCPAANGIVQAKDGSTTQIDLSPKSYAGQENAASIALDIQYGSFHYLTAGDLTGGGMTDGFLTPDVESSLAAAVGKVDVLHVNHHGSLSSSNPNFVRDTAPQAIFIQAGKDNPYGHPNPNILKRWDEIGAEIFSTVEQGEFILESNGDGFEIGPISH